MRLIETLFSALLFLTVISLTIKELHNLQIESIESSKRVERSRKLSIIKNWIDELTRGADEHRLSFGIQIGESKELTLSSSLALQPSTNSQYIRAVNINVLKTYEIKSNTSDNNNLKALGCSRYSSNFKVTSDNEFFIGISSDGWIALNGKNYYLPSQKNCRQFELTRNESLQNTIVLTDSLAQIKLLIPIESDITLYHDRNKTIRYLNNRRGFYTENQPLLNHIEKFNVQSLESKKEDHRAFNIKVTFSNDHESSFISYNSLKQTDIYNLLLH